jgi:hypothetical protein
MKLQILDLLSADPPDRQYLLCICLEILKSNSLPLSFLIPMDYYDYDTFCCPTRDFKHSPLVEWPQHSFYQHNSLLSPDHGTPRIKQEELGGFLSYPHHQQPRSYDALNLPQQALHSPYSAILQSLHTGVSISQQSRYYPTQSMQEQQQRRFPMRQQQQEPAYEYSGSPVHVAPSLLSPLVDQVGCDPNFVSIPRDSISHALEGWDDDTPRSLSSLVESEMNEMTAMIGMGNVVEHTIGDEDAEGEEEWEEEVPQPYGSHKRHFHPSSSPVTSDDWEEDWQLSGTKKRHSQPASSSVASSPIPIPVPNLTKKSRGRRVPTMSSLEDIRSAASGAGKKRQGIGGKTARMYLCEVKGCGKCFARGEHLKRHVRSIHTYEKREVLFFAL